AEVTAGVEGPKTHGPRGGAQAQRHWRSGTRHGRWDWGHENTKAQNNYARKGQPVVFRGSAFCVLVFSWPVAVFEPIRRQDPIATGAFAPTRGKTQSFAAACVSALRAAALHFPAWFGTGSPLIPYYCYHDTAWRRIIAA